MAQLGAGFGTGYPGTIDTRQVYQNAPMAAPDSDTRVDAEFLNDTLDTLVTLETILGANIQGTFASLAARLDYFLPDSPASTALVHFTDATVVNVFGGVAPLTTAQLVWSIWDANTPRLIVQPNTFSVHLSTFQVIVTFNVIQSGILVMDAPPTRYESTFTNTTSIAVPGVAHALGTADLFWSLYDASTPSEAFQPETLTVHPTTFDVTVTFGFPRSGRIVLTPGRTGYAQSFTNAGAVTIPGTTHNLGTDPLLYQVYDAQTPRRAILPGSLSMDSTTGDVIIRFPGALQSGRLLLASVVTPPALMTTLRVPAPPQGKIGPIDPMPMVLSWLRTLESRLLALETQQLDLLSHLTRPGTPEETS